MDMIERIAGRLGLRLRVKRGAKGAPRGERVAAQFFLGSEVMEEGTLGHAGHPADFLHAGRAEPALQHELAGRVEQALPGLGGVSGRAGVHTDWSVCIRSARS